MLQLLQFYLQLHFFSLKVTGYNSLEISLTLSEKPQLHLLTGLFENIHNMEHKTEQYEIFYSHFDIIFSSFSTKVLIVIVHKCVNSFLNGTIVIVMWLFLSYVQMFTIIFVFVRYRQALNQQMDKVLCSVNNVRGIKDMNLRVKSLTETWVNGVISLFQRYYTLFDLK